MTGPFEPRAVVRLWNFARPVESVSTTHGVGSDESPTRTDALEITSRVSSSMTWTNRLPLTLPSATPPPGISRRRGRAADAAATDRRTANQEEERSSFAWPPHRHTGGEKEERLAERRQSWARWDVRRRLLTSTYAQGVAQAPDAAAASQLLHDEVDQRRAAGRDGDRARHLDDLPLDRPGQASRCAEIMRVRALDLELEEAGAGIDVDLALAGRLGAGGDVGELLQEQVSAQDVGGPAAAAVGVRACRRSGWWRTSTRRRTRRSSASCPSA